jgi:tetratricopeptide (TPR) repeat protein
MSRRAVPSLPVLLALLATPTFACLWDNDTILDERRGLPGVAEVLAGKWERHSPFFYEHRVKTMTARLEKDPGDLAAYDNLAVAYEKLGKPDEAIAVMLKKEKVKPGEYTTEANLGTFYLHSADFENGIAHIRTALEINPDAHFGREKYQLMAAEFLLAAKLDPAAVDRGSFIVPELMEERDRARLKNEGRAAYLEFLERMERGVRRDVDAAREKTAGPIDGVVGMIRFGTGTSPHLYHALGDLLAYRGDRHLASRAYRRAIQYNHPEPGPLAEAIRSVEAAVEHPEQLSEGLIAQEQAAAEAWVKAYQRYEDDLIRAGREPKTEADYAPFYAQYGSARPPVSTGDAMGDVLRNLGRVGPVAAALWGVLVLSGVIKPPLALARRRDTAEAR